MKKINNPITYLIFIIIINIFIINYLKGEEFLYFTIILDLGFLLFFIPRTKKYYIKNKADIVNGKVSDIILTYENGCVGRKFDNPMHLPENNNYCIINFDYKDNNYNLLVYDESMEIAINDNVKLYIQTFKNEKYKYQMDIENNMFYGQNYKSVKMIEEPLEKIEENFPEEVLFIYHENQNLNLEHLNNGNKNIDFKNVVIEKIKK